jgi:hypothetical protein
LSESVATHMFEVWGDYAVVAIYLSCYIV